jgi:hypothetical protein
MTSRLQILTNKSRQGLRRARATARRLSRKGRKDSYPMPHKSKVSGVRANSPDWMRESLWIFPMLGATGWFLIRISDATLALVLTGIVAALMTTALCFKTVEMKRLISKALPILLFLCGLNIGDSFLITSIVESMRETGIVALRHSHELAHELVSGTKHLRQ